MSRKLAIYLFLLITILVLGACGGDKPAANEDAVEATAAASRATAPEIDLHTAVLAGDVDSVRRHIEAGSDLNVADPFGGSSPLITAATFGQTEIARLLIEAGADVNFTNAEGSTALHGAAFFCRPAIVDALLAAGIDKSIANQYGSTAYASVAGPFEQVKPFYDAMGAQLAPMGLVLDYDHIRTTRPLIAAKLAQGS